MQASERHDLITHVAPQNGELNAEDGTFGLATEQHHALQALKRRIKTRTSAHRHTSMLALTGKCLVFETGCTEPVLLPSPTRSEDEQSEETPVQQLPGEYLFDPSRDTVELLKLFSLLQRTDRTLLLWSAVHVLELWPSG